MNFLRRFLILLPGLACLVPGLAQEARFVPQFIPGKIYTYASETTVTLQLPTPDGGKGERKVKMSHEARVVTSARSAGPGAVLDTITQRLQFLITSPGREMRYDSADPTSQGSALGQHFEASRARSVLIEIDDTPKIVKAEEKGGNPGAPAGDPMPGMPQFGPDELKQMIAGLLQGFPAGSVKPGDEWSQKGRRSLGQFGEMDFEIGYHYKGDEMYQETDCAIVEFTGDLKGGVSVSGAQPGSDGGKVGFEGKNLSGRFVFDKLRRAVRESTQTVSLTIDVPGQNLKLPMTQQVTIKLVSLQDS
jgi:hypothetical protein